MKPSEQQRFLRFHRENPEIFNILRDKALAVKATGQKTFGLWPLYGSLRYERVIATKSDGYKLPNAYIAFYSRLLMQEVPELRGFFDTRGEVELPAELTTPSMESFIRTTLGQ